MICKAGDTAVAANDDATRQVEEYKATLERTMASAKKREDELLAQNVERENQLTNKLAPLADTLSGKLPFRVNLLPIRCFP